MIGRAGLVPTGFNANLGIGTSFEGRYYSSIKRRMEMGRSTSSDFISLRLRTNTTGDDPFFAPHAQYRIGFVF